MWMIRRRNGKTLEYISYGNDDKRWEVGGKVRVFGSKAAAIRYLHMRGLDQSINSKNISNLTTIELVEA